MGQAELHHPQDTYPSIVPDIFNADQGSRRRRGPQKMLELAVKKGPTEGRTQQKGEDPRRAIEIHPTSPEESTVEVLFDPREDDGLVTFSSLNNPFLHSIRRNGVWEMTTQDRRGVIPTITASYDTSDGALLLEKSDIPAHTPVALSLEDEQRRLLEDTFALLSRPHKIKTQGADIAREATRLNVDGRLLLPSLYEMIDIQRSVIAPPLENLPHDVVAPPIQTPQQAELQPALF